MSKKWFKPVSFKLYIICSVCLDYLEITLEEFDECVKDKWPTRKCTCGPTTCKFRFREDDDPYF